VKDEAVNYYISLLGVELKDKVILSKEENEFKSRNYLCSIDKVK